MFRVFILSIFCIFSFSGLAQNMEPTTEEEYVAVIKQCYTEELNEKWRMISFVYMRGDLNTEEKREVEVSSRYLTKDNKWHDAESCHPLAPIFITEFYLKHLGKFGDKFKRIEVSIYPSSKGKAVIYEKSDGI